jgi:hypothetical protein
LLKRGHSSGHNGLSTEKASSRQPCYVPES